MIKLMFIMNLYDALTQGDGSIREPHLTSLFYYILIEGTEENKNGIFLEFFINKNTNINFKDYEVESIQIEQILSFENSRRDCDITIYLKNETNKIIINIENKISNSSYQQSQINDQTKLLSQKYPNSEIINFLILPYNDGSNLNLASTATKVLYWLDDGDSLINDLISFLNSTNENNSRSSFIEFLTSFSNRLEQEKISSENLPRGPKNQYSKTMFEYLREISITWPFPDPENVRVTDLLEKFLEIVSNDLKKNGASEIEIEKFKGGAMNAQPKIMTINEKTRNGFGGIKNSKEKALFYYPDFPDGNWKGTSKWKSLRIKPLNRMTESLNYTVYWMDKNNEEIKESIYIR